MVQFSQVRDGIVHPDTKEKVPLPFRFSMFVPLNVIICAGMLGSLFQNNDDVVSSHRFVF